jgi:hypothetical protein
VVSAEYCERAEPATACLPAPFFEAFRLEQQQAPKTSQHMTSYFSLNRSPESPLSRESRYMPAKCDAFLTVMHSKKA